MMMMMTNINQENVAHLLDSKGLELRGLGVEQLSQSGPSHDTGVADLMRHQVTEYDRRPYVCGAPFRL
jgi:hypothetical protein